MRSSASKYRSSSHEQDKPVRQLWKSAGACHFPGNDACAQDREAQHLKLVDAGLITSGHKVLQLGRSLASTAVRPLMPRSASIWGVKVQFSSCVANHASPYAPQKRRASMVRDMPAQRFRCALFRAQIFHKSPAAVRCKCGSRPLHPLFAVCSLQGAGAPGQSAAILSA